MPKTESTASHQEIKRLRESGLSYAQLNRLGFTDYMITKVVRRYGLKRKFIWTDYSLNLVKTMKEDGFTYKEIAYELQDVSPMAVQKAWERYFKSVTEVTLGVTQKFTPKSSKKVP